MTPCPYRWARWYLGLGEYADRRRDPALRPACAPYPIPAAWWPWLRLHVPRPTPPSLFAGKGLFVAEGPVDETGSWWATTVLRTIDMGGSWIALQDTKRNRDWWVRALRPLPATLRFGIWLSEWSIIGLADCVAFWGPEFLVLQVEGPGSTPPGSALPLAVVTNFPDEMGSWVVGGAVCLPEAYQGDNPNATPARMLWEGKRRGFKEVYPVAGVYDGYPLAAYGEGWRSVYLAEGMTEADWKAFAEAKW